MPKTIKNEETGEDEVLYTEEEIESQKEEAKNDAIEEYKKNNPVDADEYEKTKKELNDLKELIDTQGDKGINFKKMREKEQILEKKMKDIEDKAITEIDGIKKSLTQTALETAVRGLAGEDEELAKKVKFHFENTLASVNTTSTEEFNKKVQQAYLLAAGNEIKTDVMNGGIWGSGGAGPGAGNFQAGQGNKSSKPLKPEIVDLGKKYFGLTDDDFKKFDKQDFSTTK